MNFVPVRTEEQITIVESLALSIWTEHYTPIIGRQQVEYMLRRFQSAQAITGQIAEGMLYYLIQEGCESIGYLAVQRKGKELFVSKIYVTAAQRGKGHGRSAIEFVQHIARERGLRQITLTVNKNNSDSIRAYQQWGFRNVGSLAQDIGNGFVMDDFKMEKSVERR